MGGCMVEHIDELVDGELICRVMDRLIVSG